MILILNEIIEGVALFFVYAMVFMPLLALLWAFIQSFLKDF
jgi:hypothetical protein